MGPWCPPGQPPHSHSFQPWAPPAPRGPGHGATQEPVGAAGAHRALSPRVRAKVESVSAVTRGTTGPTRRPHERGGCRRRECDRTAGGPWHAGTEGPPPAAPRPPSARTVPPDSRGQWGPVPPRKPAGWVWWVAVGPQCVGTQWGVDGDSKQGALPLGGHGQQLQPQDRTQLWASPCGPAPPTCSAPHSRPPGLSRSAGAVTALLWLRAPQGGQSHGHTCTHRRGTGLRETEAGKDPSWGECVWQGEAGRSPHAATATVLGGGGLRPPCIGL